MAGSVSQDKGPHILAVTYVMLVLATIAIALRFCARYIAHNSTVWWDDWASLVALVRLVLWYGFCLLGLTFVLVAFCLDILCIVYLLGIYWLGETYQSSLSALFTACVGSLRVQFCLQHGPFVDQTVCLTLLCSCFPTGSELSGCFLDCGCDDHRLVHSYQLPRLVHMHSDPKSMDSNRSRSLPQNTIHLFRNSYLKHCY